MTTKTLTAPDTFYGRVRGKGVVYSIAKDGSQYEVFCGRCGGTGVIEHYHYIYQGVCFACDGIRGALATISVEKANQLFTAQSKRAAAKERKRLAICAERDARVARLEASAPEVAAVLKAAYEYDGTGRRNSFHESLAAQVFNAEGKDLSEAQVAAVQRGIAKQVEEATNAVPVVEGRGQVTGVITSIKTVETQFGSATKVTVQDDRGFRVYGSLAKTLVDAFYDAWYAKTVGATDEGYGSLSSDYGPEHWFSEVKGARVSFVATVEASQDDKAFGFFSRPTKAVVV